MKALQTKSSNTTTSVTAPHFTNRGQAFFANDQQQFFQAKNPEQPGEISNKVSVTDSDSHSTRSTDSSSFFNTRNSSISQSAHSATPSIQAKCSACENEERQERKMEDNQMSTGEIQRKPIFSGGELPGIGSMHSTGGLMINKVPKPAKPVAPPASKAAASKICGPDVTREVEKTWGRIHPTFTRWSPVEKLAACFHLISPFVPQAGTNPRAGGAVPLFTGSWAEPFAAVLGDLLNALGFPDLQAMISGPSERWRLNRDAFDTIGLFVLSASWTLSVPGCGQPSCAGLTAGSLPRGYSDPCEDPSLCAFSVQMGSDCWLSGTVNYGTYGLMMREAYNWCDTQRSRLLSLMPGAMLAALPDPLAIIDNPLSVLDDPSVLLPDPSRAVDYLRLHMTDEEIIAAFLKELFSEVSVYVFVGGYKLWDMEDPRNALGWALATFNGGATSKPTGGSNRPDCLPKCKKTGALFTGWDFVWEPNKPR